MKQPHDTRFKAFRSFNQPDWSPRASSRKRLYPETAASLFPRDALPDKLVRALCDMHSVSLKEILESFEFFERVRRRMRAAQIVDLCCGHGLTGWLFAVFEPCVESVLLVDRVQSEGSKRVVEAVKQVAPWAIPKVAFMTQSLAEVGDKLPQGASYVAVHACGARTDRSIELAIEREGRLAVMPCCYAHTARRAPRALVDALGAEMATDVDRTYRLIDEGYAIDWAWIPQAITPMNRILLAMHSRTV